MAKRDRQQPTNLAQKLENEPFRFEFFQAVRILRWLAVREDAAASGPPREAIGHDCDPLREVVRLRSEPSFRFPQGDISGFRHPTTEPQGPPELTVGFMGLFGPQGVMPRHYTQLIIDRLRDRDPAMRDFLDIFNHRLISHFYRAWAKYRLPIAYEESYLAGTKDGEDRISRCFRAITGIGTEGLRRRHQFEDAALVFYAGHFAHRPKNASSLQRMLADHFRMPVEIQQFQGQWLYLEPDDQSRPGRAPLGVEWNNRLGMDMVVGRRVWSIENKFRIRLGPLRYAQFERLTPAGAELRKVAQFIRMYVGPEFDFDVQLVLQKDEVPPCQIHAGRQASMRLGWNTWARSGADRNDKDEAVFVSEGLPDGIPANHGNVAPR